jgi:hypothetical protein
MAEKDPKDAAKEFERLQKLATLLNKKLSSFNLDALKKDAVLVSELLGKWEEEFEASTSSVESMASSFQDVVRQIQKGNKGIRDTTSSFNKLTSLASDLSNHYRGIDKLTKKQLESIEKQAMVERKRLEIAYDTLEQEKQSIIAERKKGNQTASQLSQLKKIKAAQNEIEGTINGQNTAFEDLLVNARNFADVEDQINKKTGALEGIFDGLGKAFPGMANKLGLDEAQEKMREVASDPSISGMSGQMKILGAGAKTFGKNLMASLGPAALIAFAIQQIVEAMQMLDSGTGDMAKNMNITYEQALKVNGQLGTMADMSMDSALTTKKLGETLQVVNQELGTSGMISEENLKVFTKLREQAGMTNEEIMGMQKMTMVMGGTLEGNVEEFQAAAKIATYQKGIALNTKTLMADMSKLSKATQLSTAGGAKGMAQMMVAAKAVGLEMSKVENIADGLLNFEQSIESELSAELLTGKNINLEKARQAALNNDLKTVAEEINKQVGSAAEFSKMNRIQQEAMAKAAGMSREELAGMLYEQEALKAVGKDLNAQERDAYEAAKQKYGAEKAAKMLKEGQLDNMVKQQSLQDRFNQSVEKLKEVFVRLAEPVLAILDPIMQIVEALTPLVNVVLRPIINGFKAIGESIKTYIVEPLNGVKSIFSGIMDLFSGDFEEGFKKIGNGILKMVLTPFQALLNGAISMINSSIDVLNYVPGVNIKPISPIDLSSMVAFAEGGIVNGPTNALIGEAGSEAVVPLDQFYAKFDTLNTGIQTTNQLLGSGKGGASNTVTSSNSDETKRTNQLLQQLINVISQGQDISIDGQKIASALKLGARQIQ